MSERADAFVIWIDREPASAETREPPNPPNLRGRAEHVRTSERAHFESAEELVRFLERQLAARGGPDPHLKDEP